jgi:6-phosphogluconolactonase
VTAADRPRPQLHVLPSAGAVSQAAAEAIAAGLAAAIAERGIAHWSTTGGSAAPGIYRALRAAPLRDSVDWARVVVWWGDDRFVPADDALSNVLPFEQLLMADADDAAAAGLPITREHVHQIDVAGALAAGGGAADAAVAYETDLLLHGPAVDANGTPVFDVLVLGMGPDGHILSVFPGSAAWDEAALVLPIPAPSHVEPHVERVTMHPDLVTAARSVLVVTAGAGKADVLARAWAGDDVRELPVRATLAPNATWILDEGAAAGLTRG